MCPGQPSAPQRDAVCPQEEFFRSEAGNCRAGETDALPLKSD